MNKPATDADADYENDRRMSEQAFLAAYADWWETLTSQIERLPIPTLNEGELAEVTAARLTGDRVEQDLLKQQAVNPDVVLKLVKVCRAYVASELSAYLRFLQRKGMPTSQAVGESREQTKAVLAETKRKLDYGISQISETLDCEGYAEDAKNSIEYFAEAFQMEIVEPGLWLGAMAQSSPPTITETRSVAAPPKGRKRGPKPDYESAMRVAEVVERVAADGDWRSKLEELGQALDHGVCDASDPNVCEASHHEKIPLPRGWSQKRKNWLDPPDRAVMVKAIEYRLEIVSKKSITKTLS
jgi:hypothetical protein